MTYHLNSAFSLMASLDGGSHMDRVIICEKCPAVGRIPAKTHPTDDAIRRHFATRGWRVRRNGSGTCPDCQSKKRPAAQEKPTVPAPAFSLAREEPTAVFPRSVPGVDADQPPTPTRAQVRVIQDALDAAYDVERGRYNGDGSDLALAEKLDLPRAWITTERDRAYGPEGNEAELVRQAKIDVLEKRCEVLADQALALAAEFDTVKREAAKLRVLT